MYPSSSSQPGHPNLWQQEEGKEQGRYPTAEAGLYSARDQHSGYPPREHLSNGFPAREDGNRHPQREDSNRYSSREEAFQHPLREEEHHNLSSQRPSPSYPFPPPAQSDPQKMDMAHPEYQRHAEFYRMPPMAFTQPAPRQRTAIACRYCRRRKIRCSGFESSQDGRCSNCQRFNQECIFTPVSSQTQAFVPAHAFQQHINPRMAQSYGNSRGGRQYTPGPVQLYGAHGQPLPHSNANEFPPFPSRVPSPSSHSAPYEHYDPHGQESRDRPSSDVHELHPSFPRRSSQGDYPSHWPRPEAPILPLPTTFSQPKDYSPPPTVSPHSYEYQPGPSQSRRTSPPFSSDRPASISPHPPIHPPMWAPPRPESTGPSGSVGPSLHPMQLSNIIDSTQQHQQRSAHDNEMLNQLKRAL